MKNNEINAFIYNKEDALNKAKEIDENRMVKSRFFSWFSIGISKY